MEEFRNGCSHSFIYCCQVCLLPFLTLVQVFSLHDPAQPREVQGQLLNGTKVNKVESWNMSEPAKRTSCVLEKEVQEHHQKKRWERHLPHPFSVQASLVLPSPLCIMAPEACNVFITTGNAETEHGRRVGQWRYYGAEAVNADTELPKLAMNNVRMSPVLSVPTRGGLN